MKRYHLLPILLPVLWLSTGASVSFAQTAQITGRVTDASGAGSSTGRAESGRGSVDHIICADRVEGAEGAKGG